MHEPEGDGGLIRGASGLRVWNQAGHETGTLTGAFFATLNVARTRRVSDIIVTLGVHDLLEVDDVMTRKVETLIPHSNHRVIMHDYDIALIKLDVPVNFTDKMRPICLPENDTDSLLHGKCLATGWGQTRGSGSFAKLKQAHMRELPFEDCRKRGGLVFRSIDERYSFCAGDPRGEYGVCHCFSIQFFSCFFRVGPCDAVVDVEALSQLMQKTETQMRLSIAP
ncbi:hypothetical protein MRX96_035308 [Rhipicephalus microplus]